MSWDFWQNILSTKMHRSNPGLKDFVQKCWSCTLEQFTKNFFFEIQKLPRSGFNGGLSSSTNVRKDFPPKNRKKWWLVTWRRFDKKVSGLLMVLCYTMIVLKLYCSASPGERGGKPPQQVHIHPAHHVHRVCHVVDKMRALKVEINRFPLFSVACKAESGQTGHRCHRRIFSLLVRRSSSNFL